MLHMLSSFFIIDIFFHFRAFRSSKDSDDNVEKSKGGTEDAEIVHEENRANRSLYGSCANMSCDDNPDG